MAMQPTPRMRRAWFRWHATHGSNVAATCRQFGIARSTFYRWHVRLGVGRPLKTYRPHSARGLRPDAHAIFLELFDLQGVHPRWGARRLRHALLEGHSRHRIEIGLWCHGCERHPPNQVPPEATIGAWPPRPC